MKKEKMKQMMSALKNKNKRASEIEKTNPDYKNDPEWKEINNTYKTIEGIVKEDL